MVAYIFATEIIMGRKTFKDVPPKLKDKVRQVLIDLDCAEFIEED